MSNKLIEARERGIYAAAGRCAENLYELAFVHANAFEDPEFVKEFDGLWDRLIAAAPKAAGEGAMACDQLTRKFEAGLKRVLAQAKQRSSQGSLSKPS